MNKLLKSARLFTDKKDDIIKQSIFSHLSDTIKEIQYDCVEENKEFKVTDITESINHYCSTIEAIFLHGLKNSLKHRFKRVLSDVDERPDPSFWPILLVVSHRQIIDQIVNLSQITTEVGQCRSWIRLVLNDCLLSSYLLTFQQDASMLKQFYNPKAYIRDGELLEITRRLIEGVEGLKTFTLPTNSSLLNTWSLQSLIIAGVWTPTLKNCPVTPCDDVVMNMDEHTKDKLSNSQDDGSDSASSYSAMSLGSQRSGLKPVVDLSEDDVLKIILGKNQENDSRPEGSNSSDTEAINNCDSNVTPCVGNSLNRSGWSFGDQQEEDIQETKLNTIEEKSMETSFTALLESYNMLSGNCIRTPDVKDLLQKFDDESIESATPSIERIQSSVSSCCIAGESISLSVQVGKLAIEKGLNNQNYECADCKQTLQIAQKINVCYYTGEYFCPECMSETDISIPAKIIHNWDFKPYPVSKKCYAYLNDIKDHPVIDFKILNPYIYTAVEEMAQMQILRNQLNYLRAYLYTCREPVIQQLQKLMWPREYMYEHIHQYSLTDLHAIRNNLLAQELEKVVQFGKHHVANCWLCSQKGFVCEICTKPKALFPFDVEKVFICGLCNAVFHKTCLNSVLPCPKCERKKKREELPLLNAIRIG